MNDGEIAGFGLADDDDDDAAPGPSPVRASSDGPLHPTPEQGVVCAPLQLRSIDEVVTEEFVEQQVSGGGPVAGRAVLGVGRGKQRCSIGY